MSRRPLLLAGLGLLSFLFFVVLFLPATLLQRFLPADVALQGLAGTVWSGRAAAVRVGGRPLGALRWECRCATLLTGRLRYAITLEPPPSGRVELLLTAAPTGTWGIEALEGTVPLEAVAGLAVPAGWHGRIEFDDAAADFERARVTAVAGRVRFLELRAPARPAQDLGGYEIAFGEGFASADIIGGRIRDLDGPLAVRGTLRLDEGRRYVAEGEVAPRPVAPAGLVDVLTFLGPPDANGRRPFTLEGSY
jgi:general secretion pathway protein N